MDGGVRYISIMCCPATRTSNKLVLGVLSSFQSRLGWGGQQVPFNMNEHSDLASNQRTLVCGSVWMA